VTLARQALRLNSMTNGCDTIAAEESMIALLARLVHRSAASSWRPCQA
jgi:hypothetical protein